MYDCKAPLSRFYYPDTRRIINAFIIIYLNTIHSRPRFGLDCRSVAEVDFVRSFLIKMRSVGDVALNPSLHKSKRELSQHVFLSMFTFIILLAMRLSAQHNNVRW